MNLVTSNDRDRDQSLTRVLLAVHGGEPAGWGPEARRTVALWARPSVRVLGLVAVPCPPFTSLIPAAARRYRAARAAWADAERKRVQRVIDEIAPALPAEADVVWARVSYRDPGRVIAEHACMWAADVLLIAAAPAAGLWLGAVHDRVLRRARCPVLVTPVPAGREA
jgi:nucleotide-binding universal stress UspA family protein